MIKSIAPKPTLVFTAFIAGFSHQRRGLFDNTLAFIHSVQLGGLLARLVLHIWGCFPESARVLCAPLSPKMPSRLWMVGLSLGKAKPPPWLGRVQRKMSKRYKINQETRKATSQNYQTQPSWYTLLQSKSCSYLGLRPGHCPHRWAAGKSRPSYVCHSNVLIKALSGPHLRTSTVCRWAGGKQERAICFPNYLPAITIRFDFNSPS